MVDRKAILFRMHSDNLGQHFCIPEFLDTNPTLTRRPWSWHFPVELFCWASIFIKWRYDPRTAYIISSYLHLISNTALHITFFHISIFMLTKITPLTNNNYYCNLTLYQLVKCYWIFVTLYSQLMSVLRRKLN